MAKSLTNPNLPETQEYPKQILLCIYTCEADREHRSALESTVLMQQVRADPRFKILEVHADPHLTLPVCAGERLTLPCREAYNSLSEKTYQMIRSCMSMEFDFLLKVDSTIVDYHKKRHSKSANLLRKLSPEGVRTKLQSPSFFTKAYNGAVSQCASEEGFEAWMRSKGLSADYRQVFAKGSPTPPYFLGKFYALRRDLCAFIATEGEQMALEHSRYLGGSEDIMIGRLHANWKALQHHS